MIADRYKHAIIVAVLAAMSLSLYIHTLDFRMVWDDRAVIESGTTFEVREDWTRAFTVDVDNFYRPLRTISFALEQSYGELPRGYHLTNVVLFAVMCCAFYFFLYQLTGDMFISAAAALIYAAHPIHSEAVSWVGGGRANLLEGVFLFAGMGLYTRARSGRGGAAATVYVVSLALLSCALMSKESAMIYPILIVLIEVLYPAGEGGSRRGDIRKTLLRVIVFLLPAVVFFVVRAQIVGQLGQFRTPHAGGPADTIATMLPVIADYMLLLFLYLDSCAVYVPEIYDSFFTVPVFLSLLLVAVTIAVFVYSIRRHRALAMGIGWFYIALLPVSNLIPIATLKSNRFLTQPAAGCCLAAAFLISRIRVPGRFSAAVSWLLPAVIIAAGFFIARPDTFKWRDNFTLWSGTVECAPDSYIAWNNLGETCYNRGRIGEAVAAVEKAAALKPDYPGIRRNLGELYAAAGQYGNAINELAAALKLNPYDTEAAAKLGRVLFIIARDRADDDYPEKALAVMGIPGAAKTGVIEWLNNNGQTR